MQIDKRFLSADWRLENLYYIVDKKGSKQKFKPNYIQRLLNQDNSKRKIILKSRQIGVTTNELLKMTDFILFNKHKTACILAHEQDGLEKLFRIPKRAYDYMNEQLKPRVDKGGGSKYSMFFPEMNSRIYCDLESRGDAIQWLHISERAFIEDQSRVMATIECVPTDGIITIESTPNGLNSFYEMWMDEDTNYKKIFFPWFFDATNIIVNHELTKKDLTSDELTFIEYVKNQYKRDISLDQIAFRRFKQRELKNMFAQEQAESDISCFLTSGDNPFRLDLIKSAYDNAPKPIEEINGIRVYKRKDPNGIYVVAGDPAEGVGGDSSAAHVFEVRSREQVAAFDGHLKPSEFADKLVEMAELYDKGYPGPLMGVERNNHGHAVLLKLDEILEYANLYRTRKENKKTELEEMRLGWMTDRVTRPLMIDTFIEGVENGTVKLNDRKTLGECLTLTNNEGKIQAQDGKHDDLFISACICVQMCIEESTLDIYSGIKDKIKS